MLRRVRYKFRVNPPPVMPSLEHIHNLRDFDEQVTAPLHGFSDAQDYYTQSSCIAGLRRIVVPTLLLNALDDPFVPQDALPDAGDLSPMLTLELSAHGGHIGFLARGAYGLPCFWAEDRLIGFFRRVAAAAADAQ